MRNERSILSERPGDLRRAVEWGKEQQKKILEEKSERLTKSLMEQMTPLILEKKKKKV